MGRSRAENDAGALTVPPPVVIVARVGVVLVEIRSDGAHDDRQVQVRVKTRSSIPQEDESAYAQ
jgi:hypothetical protein